MDFATKKYISMTETECKSIRVMSGWTAYDEKMIDNRLVMRYINACSQIVPEMHLPDSLFTQDEMNVFSIRLHSHWLI